MVTRVPLLMPLRSRAIIAWLAGCSLLAAGVYFFWPHYHPGYARWQYRWQSWDESKTNAQAVEWFEDLKNEKVTYQGKEVAFDVTALTEDANFRHETLHKWSQWGMFDGDHWTKFVKHATSGLHPPIVKGDSVFEAGCGTGAALSSLVEMYGDLKVAGVDLSAFQANTAATILAKHAAFSGAFVKADGRELPLKFAASGFDHVIALGVICYLNSLEDVRNMLREMLMVCKPGGSLALSMLPPNDESQGSCSVAIPKAFWEDHQMVMGYKVTGFSMQKDWVDVTPTAPEAQSGGGHSSWPHYDRYAVFLTKAKAAPN